ncbi:MAG: universal stress protein [Solirubrobacteraceae bacterium]
MADQHHAVTIIMGSRGLTGVRSMLLGNVASAVAHHADRPPLVIHRPSDDTDRNAPEEWSPTRFQSQWWHPRPPTIIPRSPSCSCRILVS